MTLAEKQQLFVQLVGTLIGDVYAQPGHALTFGEAYRTPEQAALNASRGVGIANSNHTHRLAIDLNLFIDGAYQAESTAYTSLGVYWESLHPLCRWGGRFSHPDGNHFSLEHNGVS